MGLQKNSTRNRCSVAVGKPWGVCRAVFIRVRNNRAKIAAGGLNAVATQPQFFNILSVQLADKSDNIMRNES